MEITRQMGKGITVPGRQVNSEPAQNGGRYETRAHIAGCFGVAGPVLFLLGLHPVRQSVAFQVAGT